MNVDGFVTCWQCGRVGLVLVSVCVMNVWLGLCRVVTCGARRAA